MDVKALAEWFESNKRDLPWRENPSPYAVWVSEVMLQQTQVAVVIPYFQRWMDRFPTVAALAAASLDEVIKLWEGLGYYSRARNLHQGAQYVVSCHQGKLPSSYEELSKIKGLGAYTVGAILNFAYHQKIPAIDGNVMRVLTRYFAIEGDISKVKTQRSIREIALNILPDRSPWIVSEALIELGATVCQKKPKCLQCPLKKSCQAFSKGLEQTLPIKLNKQKTEYLYRTVAVVLCKDRLLLRRVLKGEIMSDLHEFPYFEVNQKGISEKKFSQLLQQRMNLKAAIEKPLPQVKHSFTKYQVTLFPFLCSTGRFQQIEGYQWVSFEEVGKLPFSSGHRRILYLVAQVKTGYARS